MTQVVLKFTGHVRERMGLDRMDFSYQGDTLEDLLEALFQDYDLRDLLLDESGKILPYSRIVVNGRFSYLIGEMQAPVRDGDMIVLIRPYLVAI